MNADVPLKSLSNEALLFRTRDLVAKSLVLEADLIEHLGEVDERRLYLDRACPSMFAFCMTEFGFSESAAYNRIGVARAGRKFPAVIAALRSGNVHLAGLRVLVPHLTELNCEQLLEEASGKSKKEIEEIAARLAPTGPVPSSIRPILEGSLAVAAPASQVSFSLAPALAPPASPATPSVMPPAIEQGEAGADATQSVAAGAPVRSWSRPVVAPLSGETFKVQFTAGRELRDKLLEAQALLRHRVPNGDLASIVEKAVDLLIASVKKERFGVVRTPRRLPLLSQSDSRHIPDAIKRAVYQRDGGRCTFVDDRGRRCESTDCLEFDHVDGFARTGVHDVDSIRLLCRAHNQHAADKMYGRSFMELARDRTSSAPSRGNSPRGEFASEQSGTASGRA
jgi:hypothetical protein